MRRIAKALGVSRSQLHARLQGDAKPRRRYQKAQDAALLPVIRRLVDTRPTYGYRRITALLRRELAKGDRPRVNHKRVYRIMKHNGLLLARHSARRPGRLHDGKVVVMRSNLRWCSDVLELSCWNSETVRIAFVIDAHDREIIAWRAVVGMGISGSEVRDLMLETVEKRFATLRAPMPVEWLSDNGSPYTAKDTRDFATQLNLVSCFTPVASPESNGLAEAFVRTFKRDYARLSPLPDAGTVLGQLGGWFDDYNHNHPHSGLGMRSAREFIAAQQPAKVSG